MSTNHIWHTTIGSPTNPSPLLLHGIFCSHVEFLHIVPYLEPRFHIILVDLPGHSRSRSPLLNTYRLAQTTSALASLIQESSPSGRAHVAGMSYGAFVGLELACRHSQVVDSVFASGAPPFEGKERFFASRPWLMRIVVGVTMHMPDTLYWWFATRAGVIKHPDLRVESKANYNMQLLRNGYADCLCVTLKEVGEIQGMRTCAVAGGRQDNLAVTRRVGEALSRADGCKAYVVGKAIHAWDWQFPDLFAEGIRVWAEGGNMPLDYEELV
jgi:pimeloyl-ACP methyl ester carboxylesterase